MEKMSTTKSRRESRKEARLAKNVQKHESWIKHKKSQKFRRDQQSKTNFGDSGSNYMTKSENSLSQNSRNNKEGIQFDTNPGRDQILEMTFKGKEMETKPETREKSGSKVSKIVKRSKSLTKCSKTKFEEFIEMETKTPDVLAQEDLEMERRLAKKLKVKDGKLRGMDDEINFLFEGIPALSDCFDRDPDSEDFSVEGFEKVTSGKQRKKRKEMDKFSGNDIAADIIGGAFESDDPFDAEKEGEESNVDTNSLRKLRKKKKKKQEGRIPGRTSNSSENFTGVSEPVETSGAEVEEGEFANGTLACKRRKKRNRSQKEEGDVAGDTTLGVSMAAETHDADMNSEENPISTHAVGSSLKYVPTYLRSLARNNPNDQIRTQIKGLVNKLSEEKVESVTGEIAIVFRSHGRSVTSQIISDEVLGCITEHNAAVYAAFVAGMSCSVGMDFSAMLLASLAKSFEASLAKSFDASLAKSFEDEYLNEDQIYLKNFALLLSYLCIFGVCSSDLVYDFLTMLNKELTKIDVSNIQTVLECILTVLECCGMKIRTDDPTAMKDFIQSIQKRVNELNATYGEDLADIVGKKIKFMLETISDIKNNKKRPKEDASQHTRIKKWLQKLRVEEIIIRGLKWSKLLDPDKKGQWWLLGEMDIKTDDVGEVASKIDKEAMEAQKMLQLAVSQGMNTDTRKAIFCIIMSAEDYVDAFEKLLRLDLHGKQDREIMRVLIECCLQEKVFNKYYTVLAHKFCEHDRNQKYTLQFCIWDQYKELDSMELLRSMHLAKFVAEMVAAFAVSLSVVKKVELIEAGQLTPKTVIHFRMFFDAIFEYPDKLVWNMFTRIAIDPELEILRNGIEFFIRKYVVKNNNAIANKFKIAKKALNNMEGVLM